MKRFLLSALLVLAGILHLSAQKQLYIPNEWYNPWPADSLLYAEDDPDNRYTWSKSRSRESDNFIVYWDKYYGNTIPTDAPSDFRVDIDDLLRKAETFYALNVGRLAFCDEQNSRVAQYKMLILMNHTTGWVCYGGGYDDRIGALWLSPSTCKPVGQAVAHEVGHSFQYQCYADLGGYAGFRTAIGNGSTFWEQTAQWQSVQAYPELKWSQSWPIFHQTANYAMTHEWMRYQSYWWHYYLAEKYGIDFVGRIWRHKPKSGLDPNQVLMEMMGWKAADLYSEFFNYAMRMATIDLDVARDEAQPYIGTYSYNYVPLANNAEEATSQTGQGLGVNAYQVAYSSCPQSTGFNIVPLGVPMAGAEVKIDFTSLASAAALAAGDPVEYFNGERMVALGNKKKYNTTPNATRRGFRLGFVALMSDGTRRYMAEDSVYCASGSGARQCTVGCTVPEGVSRLFFVVSPAPSTYIQHKWDEDISNDDQFPYTIALHGTNLFGAPVLSPDLPLTDATLTYDVYFPVAGDYSGASVTVEGDALSALGTAMQMQGSGLNATMTAWAAAGPADGQTMFYPVSSTGKLVSKGSTANGYGHWFNASGSCCDYGSGYVYSEFNPASLTFAIGQYPNRLTSGRTYTIRQALKYVSAGQTAVVYFVFRIHPTSERPAGYELVSVEQSEIVTPVAPATNMSQRLSASYSLSGIRVASPSRPGIYIVNGKKVVIN